MYEKLVNQLRRMLDWELCDYDNNFKFADETIAEAANTIEELSKPRWIPVTDRMPEEGVRVLCACRANIFCVLKWDGIDWAENLTHVYMRDFVTHWMPLPEPPREET